MKLTYFLLQTIYISLTEIVNGSCTFDFGRCGWRVIGRANYKWKLHHGNTSYTSTGPDGDHTNASSKFEIQT